MALNFAPTTYNFDRHFGFDQNCDKLFSQKKDVINSRHVFSKRKFEGTYSSILPKDNGCEQFLIIYKI
jgi:hypothetical protein